MTGMHSFVPLTPATLLERSGRAFPNRPALIHPGGTMSYGRLLDRARRLAQALSRARVGRGDRVALLMENGTHTIEAHFAIPAVGGVVVMLNPWLSPTDLLDLIRYCEPTVLIADGASFRRLAEHWPALAEQTPRLLLTERPDTADGLEAMDYESCLDAETGEKVLDQAVKSELEPVAINFTSGTTGRPKGVSYSHRAGYLHAIGQVLMLGLSRDSNYLWTLPMFHVSGWGHIWANVAVGCTQVVLGGSTIQGREAEFVEAIGRHRISHLAGSPRLLRSLVDAVQAHPSRTDLRGLTAETGGAAPPTTLIRRLEELGVRLIHQYGLNETCGPYVVNEEQDEWAVLPVEERARLRARQGVAAIHAGTGLRVIDEGGNEVPRDGRTLGEVVMAGNTLATGYYNNPDATRKAFRDGWFHSGDVAVVHPDGSLEIRDRMKDLIHVETEYGWENISSIEIENVLCRNPAIRDAAVVAVAAGHDGANRQYLVAFVETAEQGISEAVFHAYCQKELSVYKRPDVVYFDSLPKTSTGKVRKDVLVADALRRLSVTKRQPDPEMV